MSRTLSQVKAELLPQLTAQHAAELKQQTDRLLWIEYNIFPLADVHNSINSTFGEALAEWVEEEMS